MRVRNRSTLAAGALLISSCAYVGEPLPPALNIPRPVTGLAVEQVGGKVSVSFVLPSLTTEELTLAIGAIELRAGVVYPAVWPGEARSVPVTRDADGKTASGAVDAAAWAGKQIHAGVRVQSKQGKWSAWSRLAALDVVEPVVMPEDIKAEAAPEGVRIHWRAVQRKGVAVRVERRSGPGPVFVEGAMVDNGAEWIDKQARFGEEQQYRVTAVAGKARSEIFTTPAFTPVDTFAPGVPPNLSAVAGLGSIELTWDRPGEGDLAGFRIYRAIGGATEWTRLSSSAQPIAAANFSDRAIQPGTAYRYAVTSVDQAGNESQRAEPVEITAP